MLVKVLPHEFELPLVFLLAGTVLNGTNAVKSDGRSKEAIFRVRVKYRRRISRAGLSVHLGTRLFP